ncbi:hypothetical protein [Helicobacter sp.]|nr:hypothetical protein [Helicobacter sp.]
MRFYASLRDSIYRIVAIDNLARFVFHLVIARSEKTCFSIKN